jgi:D-amino peptidase
MPALDRLARFLAATDDTSAESITLRTLTLHMLEALAPKTFASQHLRPALNLALERCAQVGYGFFEARDADRVQAGLDAWFCRHVRGLPHPQPDPQQLRAALDWVGQQHPMYTWLLGEIAARCGIDVRTPVPQVPFSGLAHGYYLTHLVMLDSDYFAKQVSHPDAQTWATSLEGLVPGLAREPNLDLAGEVAFCLHFMGRDARPALSLLDHAPLAENPHEQATVLLARVAGR